jgi:hypothetical protein
MAISDGIPAVPRNKNSRNSVPNPSAEEKKTRNSVPLNKNRSKLSEYPSERFSGREKNSEFRSVTLKKEEYSRNSLPNPSAEEKKTRNSAFRTIPRKRKLLRTKRGSPNFKNSVRKDVLKSVNVYI